MTDQAQRLEIATVRAEIGSNITYRFNNDAIDAGGIPTESGDIKNLKLIIKEIEDKASVSTSIYPDVTEGLAATEEGGMFLVQSAEDDEIYVVWRKVGGVAVDTGKRALSSQAAANAVDAAQASADASQASAVLAQAAEENAVAALQWLSESIDDLAERQDKSETDIDGLQARRRYYSTSLINIDAGSTAGFAYKDGPRLVETKTGKIMAFYRVGNSHVENTGYLVYKTFNTVTKTWSTPTVLDDDPLYDTRNQMAGCDPSTGRVFCFYAVWNAPDESVYRATFYRYSDDDGVTWSARQDLAQYCPYPILNNIPFGKLISFKNGKLMVSVYNYLTIFTLTSMDGGLTWGSTSGTMPNPNPNITTMYSGLVAGGYDNITEPTIVNINDYSMVAVCRCFPTGLSQDGTAQLQYLGSNWQASTQYVNGEYSYVAGRLYFCSIGGISGTVAPTHTTGSAVDGTVTWVVAGAPGSWSAGLSVVLNQLLYAGSSRVYKVTTAGVTGSAAPTATKVIGNETQLAYFRSQDGGNTWAAPQKVTWTSALKGVSTSPPCVIMADEDTVEIAWYARYPEFSCYRVRMPARAFHQDPSYAFQVGGAPRTRIAVGAARPTADKQWDIDYGYVDLLQPSFATGVMAGWYDCPTLSHNRTDIYSTMINL